MKTIYVLVFSLLLMAGCTKGPSGLELPSIIGDNMLIQQNSDVKIWGKARKGQTITVTPSWGTAVSSKAGEDNKWLVTLKAPGAGGPHTLKVESSDTVITVNNILSGEVWLCSGQSNMEMPMAGWPPVDTIMHSEKTISEASLPEIRLFIVQRNVSAEPIENCTGTWMVCSPETVKNFSATGFFFGRRLYSELKVPVGLIESSWGGTPSEAWTSADVLENAGEFVKEIMAIKESAPIVESYRSWLDSHRKMAVKPVGDDQWAGLDFADREASKPEFDDSSWPSMVLPGLFDSKIGDFDGAVWFRKKVDIPAELKGKEMILSLGPIDDMDVTYFNGEPVGATEMGGLWQAERNYTVPGNLVKEGANTVAVRVLDTQGGGGIYGKPGSIKLSVKGDKETVIKIEGDWKYQPVAEFSGNMFYLFDMSNNDFYAQKRPAIIGPNSPSTLYNAMLNPIRNYTIKGAIWYQGESNVGRADQYSKIFPLMIENWRDAWQIKDFPFYFVQIAPYVYSHVDSVESVLLREAQTSALGLNKTGVVVTLDVTTVFNIHPPFKMEVGERLANLALSGDYEISVPCKGPSFLSASSDGKTVKIKFENAGKGLVAKNNRLTEFELAGADARYVKANAKIVGGEVWVDSPAVAKPVWVRYCWRNGAEGTLLNSDGLPAGQFMKKI